MSVSPLTRWTGPFLTVPWGRLGLPGWFRKAYFTYHNQVRLRFKFATGLGESWCRDGESVRAVLGAWCSLLLFMSIGVGTWSLCLMLGRNFLLIILSVVLSVLMLSLVLPGSLLGMLGLLVRICPGKCVLLTTSKSVRAMKLWDISGDGRFWKVQLV